MASAGLQIGAGSWYIPLLGIGGLGTSFILQLMELVLVWLVAGLWGVPRADTTGPDTGESGWGGRESLCSSFI